VSLAGKSNRDGWCVMCDEHTCSRRFIPKRSDTPTRVSMGLDFTPEEARARAKRRGWQFVASPAPGLGARDYCPIHQRSS
jgi:hypothetical protein